MKVFNVNRRYFNGQEIFDGVNLNLNCVDVSVIVTGLEKLKGLEPNPDSSRSLMLETFKKLQNG